MDNKKKLILILAIVAGMLLTGFLSYLNAKYINPRHADVDTIYHSSDEEEVRTLLHLYDVTYVIMGDLELSEFGEVNYTVLDKIGEKVFTSSDGSLTIYKVQ